jgi:hypothetical protein
VCVCSLGYPAYNAHRLHYIVICGQSGPTIFFSQYLKNGRIFGERGRGEVKEYKTCVLIFSATPHLKHFTFTEELSEICTKIYIGLHLK